MNEPYDWRRADRRLYAIAAIVFPLVILIGFGRTYYLKFAFATPPLPGFIVHIHGLIMTLWIAFFAAQVWLVRSKNTRIHMKMGWIGVALAALLVLVGLFTAAGAAKFGSASAPPVIPPINFFIVPFFDLVMFVILFGAAICYRKRLADHKRLMLLTVINFLPPAVARIPVQSLQSFGPLFFFGVPTVLIVALLVYDTRQNKKLNKAFLIGGLILIASYPLRLMLMGTSAWVGFATWITSWAA